MSHAAAEGFSALVQRLVKIRNEQGEEAYLAAARQVSVALLEQGGTSGETFVKGAFPEFDIEELKAEAQKRKASAASQKDSSPQDRAMLEAMRSQVPNMKTQAQFNVFMACFDALRGTLNAYFGMEQASAEISRDALNKALDMASKVTSIGESLKDIPEEARSETSNEFVSEPRQFHEYDTHKRLLGELTTLRTLDELKEWYARQKPQMDRIDSQNLRNGLFDAIRAKKFELGA